jgi:hypothetical protein
VTSVETQAVINLSRATGSRVVTVTASKELDAAEFYAQYASRPERFFDPPALKIDARHGASTHMVQDLIVDAALKRAGSSLRSNELRALLGVADRNALELLKPAGADAIKRFLEQPRAPGLGQQIWEMVLYDSGHKALHRPEELYPLLKTVLPGLQ